MSSEDPSAFEDDPILALLSPEQKRAVSARLSQVARQADQDRRAREEAEARANEALADAAAVRRALAAEREEQRQLVAGQTVDEYIARAFRFNFHLPRLLPKKTVVTKTKTETSSKKTTPTTTGGTSIVGKYYPLKLEVWNDCDAVLRDAFLAIRSSLGQQPVFPSKQRMDMQEDALLEDLPQEFVNAELYLTELKTSFFVHEVLEKPASRILNAYLPGHKMFFDNKNAGAHIRYLTKDGAQERSEEEPPTDVTTGGQAQSHGSPAKASPKPKIPVKVQADSIVLCVKLGGGSEPTSAGEDVDMEEEDDDDDDGDDDDKNATIYRVAFGEHKTSHRLRAPVVHQLVQKSIAPDYIVQMARRKATGRPTTDARRTVPDSAAGQVYYTYALAQTFHHMVSAGILYGYLASGDTLTFLHIPRDEPTTLRYRALVFPEFAQGVAEMDGEQRLAAMLADTASLPIALLCGLVLKAWETGRKGERWRTKALSELALFPHLPPGLVDEATAASSPTSSSSSPASSARSEKRRHDGGGGGGGGGGGDRRISKSRRLAHLANQPRAPSPLRQHDRPPASQRSWQRPLFGLRPPVFLKPHRFDPVSFRPLRPYCTQACLLGLVRGLPLDEACPNVFLHRRAALHARYGAMTADDVLPGLPGRPGPAMHAICGTEVLGQLLVLQLYGNIMQDSVCLFNKGFYGKIGCLYKLTLTGYGYTFVAKGVQTYDRRRLQREADVYDRLAAQQGRLVPVHLGTVELRLPYPRDDGILVTHMLLLSYAGPGRLSRALVRRTRRGRDLAGVDLEQEAARTWAELRALGVEDEDEENMDSNFTWCNEARRMMRIDFHCARITAGSADADADAGAVADTDATPSTPTSSLARAGKRRRRASSDEHEGRPAKHTVRTWDWGPTAMA